MSWILIHAGIKTLDFVVGYESKRMIAQAKQLIPSGLSASFIENRDWQKQNGISLLTAADRVARPFLLTMSDHVFDDGIVDHLLDSFDSDFLNVAVDGKLDSIFDYLERVKSRSGTNDCSLADGVRLMAGDDKVRAIDIGDGWWQDVDTPRMLQRAEKTMRAPATSQ